MSLPNDQPLQKLQFYVTTPYKCGYLPNKLAQSLIASPQHLINSTVYNSLIQHGFRRSGKFAYRPYCENCKECVPVRISLPEFLPSRSQSRAYQQHKNLSVTILPVAFYEDHYLLYASYQSARHPDDNLNESQKSENEEADQYRNFLCQTNVESVLVEFRLKNALKMVCVVDILLDGISAVYTFYDPTELKTSYGTYGILWQVDWARSLNLPNLYLGYWIKDSKKMNYKKNYKPLEKLIDGLWVRLTT